MDYVETEGMFFVGSHYDPDRRTYVYEYSDTLSDLNADLLSNIVNWAVADHLTLDELLSKYEGWGSWDQQHWGRKIQNGVCQTACCIAGQAAAQAGYGFVYEVDERRDGKTFFVSEYVKKKVATGTFDDKGNPNYELVGAAQSVSWIGREALGLMDFEANILFDGNNSIVRVIQISQGIARARGIELNLNDAAQTLLAKVTAEDAEYDSKPYSYAERVYEHLHDPYLDENDRTNRVANYYKSLVENFGKVVQTT